MSDVDRSAFDGPGNRIAPSILSADFARLGSQVDEVMDAGARVIHVDVMDGQFVPPITIGPLIVSAIADQVHDAGGVLDCHLMIADPERADRRVRHGRRRLDHLPRRGDAARAPAAGRDPRGRAASPASRSTRARRPSPPPRSPRSPTSCSA